MSLPHVVILGGGFAGLYAARALDGAPVRITLVDRRNHHLFQPLLYQVATAVLNPSDIAAPIRHILRQQSNVEVRLGAARSIDAAAHVVRLDEGELAYDYLIVATGSTHSYFGHPEWARAAPGLKTIEDALDIRRRVLLAYEAAEREEDASARQAWLTFIVVGGGPTGVELAGALAEISRHTMLRDFRRIDPQQARVLLVEGGPRLMPVYSPSLTDKAARQLREIGAEVRTSARVTAIDARGISLRDERIEARTVVWAAGVAASPLGKSIGAPCDKAGRVLVAPDLSVPGHPEIFVVGDLASVVSDGKPVPGLAPAAIQQGRHAAAGILLRLEGSSTQPFHYTDKGSMATIGRNRAIAEVRGLELSGFVAWCAWLFIHILYLIGFRNRAIVVGQWLWSYLTWQRGARLITGDVPREDAAAIEVPARASPPSPPSSVPASESSSPSHSPPSTPIP